MQIAKISSKNQITLTKDLLDQLSLSAGDRVLLELDSQGGALLKPVYSNPLSIISKTSKMYAKTLAKGKKKLTDSQISDVTARLVAKELAHG